jgi:hypothetical protein
MRQRQYQVKHFIKKITSDVQCCKVRTEIKEASSLHRHIEGPDLPVLCRSVTSYRDETECRTRSEKFAFQQIFFGENRSIRFCVNWSQT